MEASIKRAPKAVGVIYFWFIRLMHRFSSNTVLPKLHKEKNSLGRGLNLGCQGGNFGLWGPGLFFSFSKIHYYLRIIRKSRFLLQNQISRPMGSGSRRVL